MHELAALPIWTIEAEMKLLTLFRFILHGDMLLFLKLIVAVSEGAAVPETALSSELPISAHLYKYLVSWSKKLPLFYI